MEELKINPNEVGMLLEKAKKTNPEEVEKIMKIAAGIKKKLEERTQARTSITLDSEVMGKLRTLALNTGSQLNSIIEDALKDYFKTYERKNGEIQVPEIYKK